MCEQININKKMMECEILNSILTSTVGMLFRAPEDIKENKNTQKVDIVPEPSSAKPQDSMMWISANGKKWLEEAMNRLKIDYSKVSGKQLQGKSIEELSAEKNKVKNELKKYDANFVLLFRKQPGRVDKEPMRPLYVYYKKLKQALSKSSSSNLLKSSKQNESQKSNDKEISIKIPEKKPAAQPLKTFGEWTFKNNEEISTKISELKSERAQLRVQLDKFQQDFVKAHNRKIKYNKDIAPVAGDFKRYKELKKIIVKLDELLKT